MLNYKNLVAKATEIYNHAIFADDANTPTSKFSADADYFISYDFCYTPYGYTPNEHINEADKQRFMGLEACNGYPYDTYEEALYKCVNYYEYAHNYINMLCTFADNGIIRGFAFVDKRYPEYVYMTILFNDESWG